ncbi:cytochrome c family protein [Motiliproteus sp. MSK22-1]|uniref:c-type cytochrome n=1 Tax=Motiliproteus sp. MSK22-1 TaxID=1897630 RepID=UPI000975C80A|nr:c-type cytochrome [Motiliproteus sp. MSK22-1]OMH29072.1 hypothetical protein BGP75_20165 [Motiliproteus sp. MSK22-1]
MIKKSLTIAVIISGISLTGSLWAAKFDPSESLANYQPSLTEKFKQQLKNADIKAGADFFDRKCATCHDAAKDGIHNKGPLLWNLFGRQAGSEQGFEYSEAMTKSQHIWDFASLNYYLTRTDRAVPGRSMNFRGIRKEKQRADLLIYLRQFNDTPPELP